MQLKLEFTTCLRLVWFDWWYTTASFKRLIWQFLSHTSLRYLREPSRATVNTHYTQRLYAGQVNRFNTLPAQLKAIAANVVDIDSCCPTPWVARWLKTKPKLKWNPLRLSFPHAARWLPDASTSDIHWQLMQQLAPRGAVPVPVPVPFPVSVCLSLALSSAWLRASAGPESMAQFWLAAVLAATVLQLKNEWGAEGERQKKAERKGKQKETQNTQTGRAKRAKENELQP